VVSPVPAKTAAVNRRGFLMLLGGSGASLVILLLGLNKFSQDAASGAPGLGSTGGSVSATGTPAPV